MTPIGSRLALALVVLSACDLGDPSVPGLTPAPSVLRVTWDDGARDSEVGRGPIEVWAPIDVWFDTFLEPGSVSPQTVMLRSNGQVIRAAVLYDVLDRRVRLTPAAPLEENLTFEVVVTEGVRALGGPGGEVYEAELATGPGSDRPDAPFPIQWGELERVVHTCGGGSCHDDEETVSSCVEPSPWRVAAGLDLNSPGAIRLTAVGKPSRQWPGMLLVDPGHPDRSYLSYKVVDFHEEVIVGNVMPAAGARGAGFEAGGGTSSGACCTVDELPRLHPPPWAPPGSAKYDPDAVRRRSLAATTPTVWACACEDTRGRFPPPTEGRCRIFEGECGNGTDDDGDGRDDCDDPDCHFAPECPHTTDCDPDHDGFLDCTDPDCAGAAECRRCDADGDGLFACGDARPIAQCSGAPACEPEEDDTGTSAIEEECDDELDDDADGQTDCDDFDCAFEPSCRADLPTIEAEPVAYCRARLITDWILEGAVLGQDRRACEPLCAWSTESPDEFGPCVEDCVDDELDEDAESCAQDSLCARFDGEVPEVDANGLVQSSLVLEPEGDAETAPECAVTCRGPDVVSCAVTLGTGAVAVDVPACNAACATECEAFGELGDELFECGLGGT